MNTNQPPADEPKSFGPPLYQLAAGLAGYARWFATAREMHRAAEQAAERDAPSCLE